ncbi:unnamed protein product [Rotaria sp. Silwood2]|nr:unnamed protein product [Rotaria sp. Silwood2]CAF2931940.1 unnamed protein product [Rotaria sp. Silwood2]CAF4161310.1 unnamed protein product [Rotaria sp. Silwood2]
MPNVWLMRRRRIRPLILPSRCKQSLKPPRKKYLLLIKLMKLFAAILVLLMIGAFTVVTTLQDSNSTRYQREADLTRMERQGQLQEATEKRQNIADLAKLHEQQDYNDRVAKGLRMQNVYDAYMRGLASIILKPNINLTSSELLFARSRTLSVLDQIDLKRKWYLIKFLYDSELLYVRDVGYRFVDLGGADLSNVTFEFYQSNLSGLHFNNCHFEQLRFDQADLQNTQFNSVPSSSKIDFRRVNLIGSNFNTPYKTYVNISDSFLPNVIFITSFRSFGVNLLQNGGAEEGECYGNPYGNFTGRKTPLGWQRCGDAFQVLYNASGWKIDGMNKDLESCLFCAVVQRTNTSGALWQELMWLHWRC